MSQLSQHSNSEDHVLLNPAEYIIRVFKGVRATGRAVGRAPGNVSKWRKSGRIPSAVQEKILEVAKEKKLDIRPGDLVAGREVAKAALKALAFLLFLFF